MAESAVSKEKENKPIEEKAAAKNGIKRLIFVGVSIIVQIILLISLANRINSIADWINTGTRILAAVFVLGIYSKHQTASMKMPWIILILVFPVMGIVLYLLVGNVGTKKKMVARFDDIDRVLLPKLPTGQENMEKVERENPSFSTVSRYLKANAGYPLYNNTDVKFYNDSTEGLKAQIEEIRKAEKFVFLEYHAIEDGKAWEGLEQALRDKAAEGVEVRVFYDDIGSIFFINGDFKKRLESYGIKCRVFNPMAPFFNVFFNNRDHRKITVIDGRIAFTGGFNLADEYFNITHPFGVWKDTGIRVTGDAAKSFTVMFLEMWNAAQKNDIDDTEYDRYLERPAYTAANTGFVQPYADSPIDHEQVGEETYISIINAATKYCYFTTPYLIITDEMAHAISLAAKRGVDVRIITPGIPDKKLVYSVTRSFYNGLVRNGVKIYEWTPGFIHAKMCIVDDTVATVGTINLDYRSLYHHFENGCYLYKCDCIQDIKADFMDCFAASRDVTEQYLTGRSRMLRFGQLFMRLFAELL